MNTNERIGSWIQEKRIEKGYSQQQVADMLGVSRIAVSYWENGKRTIYAANLIEYCKVLALGREDLDELINELLPTKRKK